VVATRALASAAGNPWWDISLTSGWLVVTLALLAVGATAAAAVTWDVARFRRLRRAGLLVAAQVLTAAAIAAAANIAGGFYGSLSDLVGAGHGTGAVVRAGNAPAGGGLAVEPWLAQARRDTGPGKGVWTSLTIAGKRTGYQLPAWVYVPDAYFDPAEPNRQFPVSLLFAGYPGSPQNWQRQGHLVAVLDQLMAQHRIPPMIMIAPSQNPTGNRDSECVDAVDGARADTYLTQDVPDAISGHLRVIADRSAWSLMGYSTGGYCAVDLALRHPRQFASAISLDGYFQPAADATTGDLFKRHVDVRRSYTPIQTIHDKRDASLRFYLLVGGAEPTVKQAAHSFAAAAHKPDDVTIVDIPGGHNWGTWTAALPGALAWLSADLPQPDAGTGAPAPPPSTAPPPPAPPAVVPSRVAAGFGPRVPPAKPSGDPRR
jgi:enterochelin esterase-like enzyme